MNIEQLGEKIVADTYRHESGMYLWTDVVGAVQTAIYEERGRFMKMLIDEGWVMRMAEVEDVKEIGAGSPYAMRDLWLQALAEKFCAMPLPDSVAADQSATVQGPGRSGTNLLTVAQAKEMLGKLI